MSGSLIVTIDNKQPVELLDFTRALLAVGDQFKRDMEADASVELEVKLYVKELRKGSLIAELVPLAGAAINTAIENREAIIGFVEKTRAVIDWLRAKTEKPEKAEPQRIKNVATMLEPVAKDNGAIICISIEGNNNHVPIIVNTVEANAAQNRARNYLDTLKEPALDVRTKQLMYWDQVRNQDGPPKSGEKAVIESITTRPTKVVFDSRDLRDEMLYGRDNPLKEAYLVDVEVQTVRGKIATYKILQMHERVRLEEDETARPVAAPE